MSSAASMIYPAIAATATNQSSNDPISRHHHHQRCQRRNSLPRTFLSSSIHNKNNGINGLGNRKQLFYSGCDPIAAASATTTTSTVSLHYISQYLTPDTLILPRQLLLQSQPLSANINTNNIVTIQSPTITSSCPFVNSDAHPQSLPQHHSNICHHHSHQHHHPHPDLNHSNQHNTHHPSTKQHQIHLDMKMAHQNNTDTVTAGIDNCVGGLNVKTDSVVDAATAQLEEIIRLCRTLQSKTNSTGNTNTSINNGSLFWHNNIQHHASSNLMNIKDQKYHHCSGNCNIYPSCRCSADCLQYFIQNQEFKKEENIVSNKMTAEQSSVHQNKENDAGETAKKDMLVINHNDFDPKQQQLTKPVSESIDDLRHSTTIASLNDNNNDVELCQLLNMDSNKNTTPNNNNNIIENAIESSGMKSAPTIHHYQHLQPTTTTNITIMSVQNQNSIESNFNNNNCSNSRTVTELVAKFEDKKKKYSQPSPPTRSWSSPSSSSSSTVSPSTPTTTSSSPCSSFYPMSFNNDNNTNNHDRQFRDKHEADTYSVITTTDDNNQHQQQHQQSKSSSTSLSTLNDKRIRLPSQPLSSLLPKPKTTSATNEQDNSSDFSNNNANNNHNNKSKLLKPPKPKPPPKPTSLLLQLSSSNLAKNNQIKTATTSALSIATNSFKNKQNDKCQKVSPTTDQQQQPSPQPLTTDFDHHSLLLVEKEQIGHNQIDSHFDKDVKNHVNSIDVNQISSTTVFSSPLLLDPVVVSQNIESDIISIHSNIDEDNNSNDKSIKEDDDKNIIDLAPPQLSSSSSLEVSQPNETICNSIVCKNEQLHLQSTKSLSLQVTDLDQVTIILDSNKESNNNNNKSTMATNVSNLTSTSKSDEQNKCQSYCCCCCCPSTGSYGTGCSNSNNNKLLGIDLTKLHHHQQQNNNSTTNKPNNIIVKPPRKSINHQYNHNNKSDLISNDHHIKQQQPNSSLEKTTTKNNQSLINNDNLNKCKTTTTTIKCSDPSNEVLVVVDEINSDEQSAIGSSDNSSSDEGIENPAILDDDDEEDDIDDEVDLLNNKLSVAVDSNSSSCHFHNRLSHSSHSHHQHHLNHHNQLFNHNHHQDPNRKSPSLSFKSNRTVSPLFPQSTNPDDVHQVERFLNGTNSKHLNQLKQEESLLLQEIFEVESEQAETTTNTSTNDEIDEELLEFQRIEREIKLSELRKCLQIVQKQIQNYQFKLELEETKTIKTASTINEFDTITMATTNSDLSFNNEKSEIEKAQHELENNLNNKTKSKSSTMAPLAEPEMDEVSKTDSLEPEINEFIINPELDLSDSDESCSEEVAEPITPKVEIVQNPEQLVRSLDDLLHESIETRLEKVNDVTEQEQESFVANSVKPEESSLMRRTSQYDNEKTHDCRMRHFGYQRNVDMLMLKSVYQKLELDKYDSETEEKNNMMNASSISNEMLESTTTATDSETDSIVLRRRSARFPAGDSNDSNPNLQSQDELSTHSDQPVLRAKRISAISSNSSTAVGTSSGSQRPLTLYMPAPNQKINLITHLHALGHDLTSSIVTNHLLLTPYTCSGYLYKHCSSGVGKWRKRYFHFDRVRKVFVYYHDRADFEKMRHPKRGVFFDEIQDVYVDHTRINMKKFLSNSGSNDKQSNLSNQHKYGSPGAMTNPAKADGTRCVFVVSTATFSRKFILSTYTPELMRIWMDVIFTGAQAYLQDFDDQLMN